MNDTTDKIKSAGRRFVRAARKLTRPVAEPVVEQDGPQDGRARLKKAYTNARRAGRTKPGKIEFIEPGDPRASGIPHKDRNAQPNRVSYRSYGYHGKNGGPRQYPVKTRNPSIKLVNHETGVSVRFLATGQPQTKFVGRLKDDVRLARAKREATSNT